MDEIKKIEEVEDMLADVGPDGENNFEIEDPPEDDETYTPKKFTFDKQKQFLEDFAKTGNMTVSAKKAGVSRQLIYHAKERSERFKRMFETAKEVAIDMLEEEARNYAVDGKVTYEEYDENGNLVAQRKEYSEKLLLRLLEAHRPDTYDSDEPDGIQGDITIEVHPKEESEMKEVIEEGEKDQ